jgi:alanine-synthesizing transaminase
MSQQFHRISRLPPYVFAEVTKLKQKYRAEGRDIIDFGMGNPDSPTPPHIVEKLREAILDPKTHRYSLSRGIAGLRKAQAVYYARRFNVELDPESEIIATIGSKEGLANLANAITRPGDSFIVADPSYPIHPYGFIIAEGMVISLPKVENMRFIDQVRAAVESSHPKPKAIIVNYPCNPTAECVDLEFYEEIVDYCRHEGIYVLSDLAYCEIYFDSPPPSILQVKGAKDIAVEFTTVSKTYSMAGWRIGFAVGNKTLIGALTKIKSYLDYGAFAPCQIAATAALNGPQDCVAEIRQKYKDRRDVLVDGLHKAGWMVEVPKASMFVWAEIPEKFKSLGSLEFSIGKGGDTHVRIALVENQHRIRQAIKNMKKFLHDY